MCLSITLLLICSFVSVSHGAQENDLPISMLHQMHVKKGATKTFEIDNDINECINIYEQPAFQHPLLVNHTLQLKPNYPGETNDYTYGPSPAWNTSRSCPEGSIPIEKIQRNGHVRGNLSVNHAYKHPHHFLKQRGIQQISDPQTHEHSLIVVNGGKFYGLKATLNVWNPKLEKEDEASASQVWIIGGDTMNTLEAGWTVAPKIFGGTETHFFTFWTADNYKTTGCPNLLCPGFVQTNPHTILGAILQPVSVYGGQQYVIDIEIFQDKTTKNWWLRLQGVDMGYWPKVLFPVLLEGADAVGLGGEVMYLPGGAHTSTHMGSGHFAEEGSKKSSYVRNIQVLDTSNVYVNPPHISPREDARSCYDMQIGKKTDGPWGHFFFFGGPGRSEQCT